MPVIPSGAPASVATFQLSCNGTPFPNSIDLVELNTTQTMDGSGRATLRFSAALIDGGWDAALQVAPLGAVLEVALGYHADVQSVFTGTVQAHRLRLSETGAPELVMEAVSHSVPAAWQETIALSVQYGASLLALEAERTLIDTPANGAAFRITGQAMMFGTTVIDPGDLLALHGLGDAFNGSVRILAVHHLFSRGGWTTRVDYTTD